ncbi:putative E3 ubiquitin-protein ligase RZFP34 [Dictyocoela muelleri]|nr:putative E3 ubiquitin-protein ligase RZFP34 [Dictyocoela muelleri]
MSFETGCNHYKRNCLIISSCCQHTYPCSFCHDSIENHKMDNQKTKFMICLFCGTTQILSNTCIMCYKRMATYFCKKCNLFDESPFFHCDECKMCFKGKKFDFFHCDKCSCCLEIGLKDKHSHVENSLMGSCPICTEFVFESINDFGDRNDNKKVFKCLPKKGYDGEGDNNDDNGNNTIHDNYNSEHRNYYKRDVLILDCGHPIHRDCYSMYKKTSYNCPICRKSTGDPEIMNKMIQELIKKNPIENKIICDIYCYDCRQVTRCNYIFVFNQCIKCLSFNTRVGEIFNDEEY